MEGTDTVTNLSLLSDSEVIGLKYLVDSLGWMPTNSFVLEAIRSLSQQMYDEIEARNIEDLVKQYEFGK